MSIKEQDRPAIEADGEGAYMVLDSVIEPGESWEDVARLIAGRFKDQITWTTRDAGNGCVEIRYRGECEVLRRVSTRYMSIGKNKGKAPAKRGEKRTAPAKGRSS